MQNKFLTGTEQTPLNFMLDIENIDVKPLIEKLVRIDSGELLIEIANVISDSKQDYSFFIDRHARIFIQHT